MTDQPVVISDSDSGRAIADTLLVLLGEHATDDVFGIGLSRFRAAMQEGIDLPELLRRDLSNIQLNPPISEATRNTVRALLTAEKAVREFLNQAQASALVDFERYDRVRLWTGKIYLCDNPVSGQILSGIPESPDFHEVHVHPMTEAEVTAGTSTDPGIPSPALLKLAAMIHGGSDPDAVTAAALVAAIAAHNAAGDAHADIRALIAAIAPGVSSEALAAAIAAHNAAVDAHADIRALIAAIAPGVSSEALTAAVAAHNVADDAHEDIRALISASQTAADTVVFALLRPGSDPTKLILENIGTVSPVGRFTETTGPPHYVAHGGGYSLNVAGAQDFAALLANDIRLGGSGDYDSLLNRPIVRGTVGTVAATAANVQMLLLDTSVMRLYRNVLHRGHDATATWRDFTSADLRVAAGESTLSFVGVRGSYLDVNTAAAQPGDVFYLRDTDHFVRWNGSVLLTLGLPKHVQGQFVSEAQALHQLADDVGSGNGVGYFAAYDLQGAFRAQATVRITTAYTAPTADTREWLDLQRGLVEGLAALAAQAASITEDIAALRSSAVRVRLNANGAWTLGSSWQQSGSRFDDADLIINVSGWARGTAGGNNYLIVPAGGGGVYQLAVTVNYSPGSASGDRAAVTLRSRIAFNSGAALRADPVVATSYYRGGSQSSDIDRYSVTLVGLVVLEAGDWVNFEAQAFETVSLDLDAGSFMSLARV